MNDVQLKAPEPWSYSRLTAFELCPRRYDEVQRRKLWGEERSEQLAFGDEVHEAMAAALRGTPLPASLQVFSHWVEKVLRTPGELLVECKWAITREFKPTPWFSNKVWLRSIADAVKLDNDVGLLVDWKTGKSANADEVQLQLTSLIMFIHFPKLQCVRSDFVWLQEDEHTTQVLYRNEAPDVWAEILPRVKRLEQATIDEEFPPKPGRFCRSWCPVATCEYHGKG